MLSQCIACLSWWISPWITGFTDCTQRCPRELHELRAGKHWFAKAFISKIAVCRVSHRAATRVTASHFGVLCTFSTTDIPQWSPPFWNYPICVNLACY